MTGKSTSRHKRLVRVNGAAEKTAVAPLSNEFKALSDEEVERRSEADPDAGVIPPGFWESASASDGEGEEQIVLRLDPEVLRHFRRAGDDYRSRINAVLRRYVRDKEKQA